MERLSFTFVFHANDFCRLQFAVYTLNGSFVFGVNKQIIFYFSDRFIQYLVKLSMSVVVLRAYALNKCIMMSLRCPPRPYHDWIKIWVRVRDLKKVPCFFDILTNLKQFLRSTKESASLFSIFVSCVF